MTLLRAARPAAIVILVAFALASFAGNQRHVFASVVPLGFGSQIVCSVFTWLDAQGRPIPHLLPNGCSETPPPGSGTLKVVKQVSGGTAVPSDFSIHIKAGESDISGSPQPGSASGTAYTGFPPGSYTVSETGGPANYTASFSGACNGSGVVDIAVGDIKTCTITNTFSATPAPPENTLALCTDGVDNDSDALLDLADPGCAAFLPKIVVKTLVVNTAGGSATSTDFTIHVTSTGFADSFPGSAAGRTSTLPGAGAYSVTADSVSGYVITASADCSGTASAGDTKTCTFTSTFQATGTPTQCADGVDNDGDTKTDSADPGCHTDFNPENAASYDPTRTDENAAAPPAPPKCSDGIDNDGDGKVDGADPGCVGPSDDDETDTATTNTGGGSGTSNTNTGGGGGGGGPITGSFGVVDGTVGGAVLGESTTTIPIVESCDTYLTAFIKTGQLNDPEQVRRLQFVLRDFEGADIDVSGVYDDATLAAVHAFQTKYASEILTPWGIGESTGFVYLTTRKKVNEIYCNNTKQFPLTEAQLEEIARYRAQLTGVSAPASSAQPSAPVPASGSTFVLPPEPQPSAQVGFAGEAASGANAPDQGRGVWNFIDFLRRFLPSR